MAVTAFWYIKAFVALANKEIDLLDDEIRVSLHTVTYVPNQDTHDYADDRTNELATANGYTVNGEQLAGPDTYTTTLNVATYDAANTVWTSSGAGFTARIAVTTDRTPVTDITRPLLWWMDFGQNETASGGGTFTLNYNASGIATITASDAAGFP